MSVAPVAPPAAWADRARPTPPSAARADWSRGSRTFCLVELQKLRHDRIRAGHPRDPADPVAGDLRRDVQPRSTRSRPATCPTSTTSRPGIIAQSALFVSIFYGIQIIWERDAGVLTKLLVTPTPRVALVAGKAFAAGHAVADRRPSSC